MDGWQGWSQTASRFAGDEAVERVLPRGSSKSLLVGHEGCREAGETDRERYRFRVSQHHRETQQSGTTAPAMKLGMNWQAKTGPGNAFSLTCRRSGLP